MIDTSSEEHRHSCEARYVANLPNNERRKAYLDGVAAKRGKAAADRLRLDAWSIMRERAA